MKNTLIVTIAVLITGNSWAATSDSTGNSGDNLDLFGVLELFKKATSMEAFEKAINDEKNQVNNLDLNGDGETDYIRVIDHREGDDHAIVLQVPVNDKESQDVASIEIEKTAENTAQLQIIGDEAVYGKDYIIEPKEDAAATKFMRIVVVNVWMWPNVKFIYGPKYAVWVSPWHWKKYPGWWKPWRCVSYNVHHARVARYRTHCHRVHVHRVVRAHKIYHKHRVVSATYHNRHAARKGTPGKKVSRTRKTNTVKKAPARKPSGKRK